MDSKCEKFIIILFAKASLCLLFGLGIFFNGFAQIQMDELKKNFNLNQFEILEIDLNEVYSQSLNKDEFTIELDLKLYGKLKINLTRNSIIMGKGNLFVIQNGVKRKVKDYPDINHWKGNIDKSSKIVRFNIYSNSLSAYIEQDSSAILLETKEINGQNKVLVYCSKDIDKDKMNGSCGLNGSDKMFKHNAEYEPENALLSYSSECVFLKLNTVSTYGLFKQNNYDTIATFNEMRDIINITNGPYSQYTSLRIGVSAQFISLDSLSDYNTSNDLQKRLNYFNTASSQFKSNIEPDIYHLFSERFNGVSSAIGYAYIGKVCEKFNVSVSVDYVNLFSRANILAHELGHNLGAIHTDGTTCGTSAQSIMCPEANAGAGLVFRFAEIKVITNFVNTKKGNSSLPYCMAYPFEVNKNYLNLCDHDSDLLTAQTFNGSIAHFYNGKMQKKYSGEISIQIKNPGLHQLLFFTDTLNDVSCNVVKEVYAAERDFEVSTNKTEGKGSLMYAILNSNICSGIDTIRFALPNLINTLTIDKVLPPIIDDCVLDGRSQSGYVSLDTIKHYKPTVIIKNALQKGNVKYGLLFGMGTYEVNGIGLYGFDVGISNAISNFSYSDYSWWTPIKEGNPNIKYSVNGCKFVSNKIAIDLDVEDKTPNNDFISIGNGKLNSSNIFISDNGKGLVLRGVENLSINGNYFGTEPGLDSVPAKSFIGITLFNCDNFKFQNNYILGTLYEGLAIYSGSGVVYGNKFGIDPFSRRLLGFKGAGIATYGESNIGVLSIGGLGLKQGNEFYHQMNASNWRGAYLSQSYKNVQFVGNKSYSPDTSSMIHKFALEKNVEYYGLDSVRHNCGLSTSMVYGKLKPNLADTFTLHFYSAPEGIKGNKQSIHSYLGSKQIIAKDTFLVSFSHMLSNCAKNEGILFTVTSSEKKYTYPQSLVMYPINSSLSTLFDFLDSSLCPMQKLSLKLNSNYSNFKLNGNTINGDTLYLAQSGHYSISAQDQNACLTQHDLNIYQYPNYLSNTFIDGSAIYKHDSVFNYALNGLYNKNNWSKFDWLAVNGFADNFKQLSTAAIFLNSKAGLTYRITDKNKCTYEIKKDLLHSLDYTNLKNEVLVKVYPNPSNDGIYFIEGKNINHLELFTSSGEKVEIINDTDLDKIDLSGKSKGIYFLRVNHSTNIKLIRL